MHGFIFLGVFFQVLAMCFIRKALDWFFTQDELRWLDDVMPEMHNRAKEDKEKEEVGFWWPFQRRFSGMSLLVSHMWK